VVVLLMRGLLFLRHHHLLIQLPLPAHRAGSHLFSTVASVTTLARPTSSSIVAP
jgi:hypothetical protein